MGLLKITVLGCGASVGVPAIGNDWGKCDPTEPKNYRTRASLAVQSDERCLIIDTGPDFRMQLNRENIKNVDAVLYSHPHGDHVHGIDELRFFQRRKRKPMPIYGNRATMEELRERFAYMFHDKTKGLYPTACVETAFRDEDYGVKQSLCGISFTPYVQDHKTCESLGFRFGDVAYSTDMWRLGEGAIETLQGVKTWIVDGAAHYMTDPSVHASIPYVIELNEKHIGAAEVYFTHLTMGMDYNELKKSLPKGYFPCYDGLTFTTDITE